jgi:eukaryotic-like serine/threonine-protein kinase
LQSAACRLEGKTLDGGWKVLQRVQQDPDATGGHFSVGYLVEHNDGRKGYLKALDYAKAFSGQSKPVSIALEELTASINFEKYVLARCRDRRLDRIVISIADGTYVDGQPGVDTVEYLIFELADGDVRKHMKVVGKLDVLWRLKALHHIATGLHQLHTNDIVHQDIKPSNILVFKGDLSKIADVGRSACRGQIPPHFSSLFAGDWTYAPPDVLYQFALPDQIMRPLSFDAYLLGSMVVYFFTSHAMTPLLLSELHPAYADWEHYAGSTDDIKLHLQDAFGRAMDAFARHVPECLRTPLVSIVRHLCEPDPTRRGHPDERPGTLNQFSLQRYRTTFDLLLKRAEAGLIRP